MPNTPTPAPKGNGLTKRLASLSESAVIADFVLERISRDAGRPGGVPAAVLGTLSGVQRAEGGRTSALSHTVSRVMANSAPTTGELRD